MRVSRACKVWTVKAQAVPLNLRNETDLVRDRDTRDSRLGSLGPHAGQNPQVTGPARLTGCNSVGWGHAWPRVLCRARQRQTTPGPRSSFILWKHALVIVFVPADLWSLPHGLRGLASPLQGSD